MRRTRRLAWRNFAGGDHMDVFWLEQRQADIAPDDCWLSATELARLASIRFPKRRADWRLGRWTAKCAVATLLQLPGFSEIEIRPAPSGAPEVFIGQQAAPLTLSLSHRDGMAMCTVSGSGVTLGCDLEIIEPRIDSFIADYFIAEEEQLVSKTPGAERDRIITLIWSAKESALKALQVGLRADTRDVIVSHVDASAAERGCWYPFQVRERGGRNFEGWWQCTGNFVRTMVAIPPCLEPVLLHRFVYFG